jgi:phosphatidylserine/phosphatidylglycerophosphate/cardiolipin synthase-like enzyme
MIVLSIIFLFSIADPLRDRLISLTPDNSKLSKFLKMITPVSLGLTGVVAWAVWTFIMVFTLTLMITQGAVIGFIFLACLFVYLKFKKKDNTAEKLEKDKNDLQKRFVKLTLSYAILEKENEANIEWLRTPAQHRELLLHSLKVTSERIIILSGWLTDWAFNDEFRSLLLEALKRGVRVYIGYGWRAKNDPKVPNKEQKTAQQDLHNLQAWCAENKPEGRLDVAYYPNHSKLLLVDSSYVVCGSFNWLSNSSAGYNQEMSVKLSNTETVNKEAEKLIADFESQPPTRRGFFKRLIPFIEH